MSYERRFAAEGLEHALKVLKACNPTVLPPGLNRASYVNAVNNIVEAIKFLKDEDEALERFFSHDE